MGARGPLSDAQFATLRLWAMDFRMARAVGIAVWPFGYTDAQKERLKELASAVPEWNWLIWVLIFVIIWFAVGILITAVAMFPLAATLAKHPDTLPALVFVLLMSGIIANLLSAYVLGSVIATWLAGRLLDAIMPLPGLDQTNGDAELLEGIRQQVRRTAIFGALSVGLALLASGFSLLFVDAIPVDTTLRGIETAKAWTAERS